MSVHWLCALVGFPFFFLFGGSASWRVYGCLMPGTASTGPAGALHTDDDDGEGRRGHDGGQVTQLETCHLYCLSCLNN